MRIQLSAAEAARIKKPVNGRGGFQTLHRRVQRNIDGNNVLEVSDADADKTVRYFFGYGQGGFQDRTEPVVRQALDDAPYLEGF